MKEKIHPDYHPITVVMTDGSKYETRSTWGKPGDVLQLDVDPKTHPAWVGGVSLRKTGQMEKFTNKFAFLDKGAAAAPKKEAKPEAAADKKEAKPEAAAGKSAEKKEAKTDKKEEKVAKKDKAEKKEEKKEDKKD